MSLRANSHMLKKLLIVAAGMFAFGYALVPMYRTICEVTGINILALGERELPGSGSAKAKMPANTQIDASRTITVELDANARGPWEFKPAQRSVQVHPGEVVSVMYEFKNVQDHTMSAQAIPSYAPRQAAQHFNKLQCFCFTEQRLKAGEKREMAVVFYVDPAMAKDADGADVNTITLSYSFYP